MAAAVAPRLPNDSHPHHLKMSSPKDSKRNLQSKQEDPPEKVENPDEKIAITTSNPQPLAPPPKPSQANGSDPPDYFSQVHGGSNSTFSLEPNPFEQSFGNPSSETPGKSILPPVASITSPAPLQGVTPGWSSLRSGPLSPAMLTGPQNATDYFSDSFRGGFPTPNESGLRTGLTPGGGGSMFPAPSPNSQALFNLQSGGATPSTLDFHRTALSAAAAANVKQFNLQSTAPTSQAVDATSGPQMDRAQPTQAQQQQQQQRSQAEMYNGHDVNTAANDLLQFATQGNGAARNGQFAVPTQPNHVNTNIHMSNQSAETSPTQPRRGTKSSIATSIGSLETGEDHSESGQSEQAKPATRSKGKKGANNKSAPNNRRKADDTPSKAPAIKKQKGGNGAVQMPSFDDDDDSDDDLDAKMEDDEKGPNGKKMTDEEKRKNFLERNRIAALKCRQRKKQWLANLQAKVELFSTENDALSAQVTQLREEVVNLKTLLLAHKDCAVSQAQGLSGMAMNTLIGDINHHANPYGMAMQPNGMGMPMGGQGQMPRTYVE